MRRRDVIALLGAASAFPRVATGQQTKPLIGLLHSASRTYLTKFSASIDYGLKEAGFFEGQNLAIEYRWAEGHYERLPALATELVARNVSLIFAVGGTDPARAAKAATNDVPIIFVSAADPVRTGLVASLSRPGGNVTGVSLIASALDAKKMGLLIELVPKASTIAVLANPNYPEFRAQQKEVRESATRLGVKLIELSASTEAEIDAAFEKVRDAGALLVCSDPFFNSRHSQFAELTTKYAIPAIFAQKEFVTAGCLASYGPSFADGYRQGGVYIGRVLRGEKPADLPIVQPTKFEMSLNLKSARALGLDITPTLLGRADDVIDQ